MCAACTGSSLNISEKTIPRLKTSHAEVTTESGGQYCWQVMGGTSPSTETEPKSIMNTLRWSSSMKLLGLMSQWTKPKCARCSTLSSRAFQWLAGSTSQIPSRTWPKILPRSREAVQRSTSGHPPLSRQSPCRAMLALTSPHRPP